MEKVRCEVVGTLNGGGYEKMHEQSRRVYGGNGLSPTLHTCGGGNLEPKILEEPEGFRFYKQAKETATKNDCKFGDTIDAFNQKVNKTGVSPTDTTRPEGFKTAILTVDEPIILDDYNGRIREDQSTIGSLTTNCGNEAPRNGWKVIEPNIRIRKLTPKECFRLMDFDDADIDKAKASGVSDSQLYKQAGNSIVVAVLEAIFKEML